MSIFYLDWDLGNDATTATPLGWWSIAITNGTGGAPVADEACTGGTSGAHAHLTVYVHSSGSWAGGNEAGTLYFYGYEGTFSVGGEQINWAAGHGHTSSGITYCAWKSLKLGGTAVRLSSAGDEVRITKNGTIPTILSGATGKATWVSGQKYITLDDAQTANIDMCETAWTGVTGLITVLNATPTNGGTGYTLNDILTIVTGGTAATCKVTGVSLGVVTQVTLLTGGNGGYTTGPGKVTTGGTGAGDCTVNITTVGSATVTRLSSDAKEGTYSMKIQVPTGCMPGSKLAYYPISPGSLTAYQKMSFWYKGPATTITANQWRVVLCSDGSGVTVVDEFKLPAIPAGSWTPLNLLSTGAGNLGASTASIAIYSDTVSPTSASYIYVDDFIACTTNGLNLQSLISKDSAEHSTSSGDGWCPIQSINGTIVYLDGYTADIKSGAGQPYYSVTASENVNTYYRETFKFPMPTSPNSLNNEQLMGNGTIYSGGWNSANNQQDGDSWLDNLNGNGYGIMTSGDNCHIGHVSVVRAYYGLDVNVGTFVIDEVLNFIGNYQAIRLTADYYNTVIQGSLYLNYNQYAIMVQNATGLKIDTLFSKSNYGAFNLSTAGQFLIYDMYSYANYMTIYGSPRGLSKIINLDVKDSGSTTFNLGSDPVLFILNADIDLSVDSWWVGNAPAVGRIYIDYIVSTGYPAMLYSSNSYVTGQAATAGGTGMEWRVANSNVNSHLNSYPMEFVIARIRCNANKKVTVGVYVKKWHASGYSAIVCYKKQLPGIDEDKIAIAPNNTSRNLLSIDFTPTRAGVVEIKASSAPFAGLSDGDIYDGLVSIVESEP